MREILFPKNSTEFVSRWLGSWGMDVKLTLMNTNEILEIIRSRPLVLGYFSTPGCNVCKSLLPKVKRLVAEYPEFTFVYVDTEQHPYLAGQYMVFAVPTLILFAEGREWKRFSRFIGLAELEAELEQLNLLVKSME